MTINKYIYELNQIKQSIWYDNLSKDVLESGELANLIAQGVSGLTSNPTIFQKAIATSDKYDAAIKNLIKIDSSNESVCEELMIADVAAAADLLSPVYLASAGMDGYASIEVSPLLAHDKDSTVQAAKRIWSKLNRPNIMIKIPATKACIPAIQEVLEEGINVNVTLIFSVATYKEVAQAYIEALKNRLDSGRSINKISSVASFFVSRVDSIFESEVEKKLKGNQNLIEKANGLIGKVGIANSKLAYLAFNDLFFKSESFKKLSGHGAMLQRPLWASTGTKNPAFSPVLYIEELAGENTVNTVPPATLKALLASCNVKNNLVKESDKAQNIIQAVGDLGLNFNQMLGDLQIQGVELFANSYKDLLNAVQVKINKLSNT
jgi:transaldolase